MSKASLRLTASQLNAQYQAGEIDLIDLGVALSEKGYSTDKVAVITTWASNQRLLAEIEKISKGKED